MPRHNFRPLQGELVYLEIDSAAIADNQLGDPGARQVLVYLPAAYRAQPTRQFAWFLALAAFTSSGLKLNNWNSFDESLPQRFDRLIADEKMPPCVLVMPDCFTSLGGNQYLNSPVLGRWEDFIYEDLIPRVVDDFRVHPQAGARAIFGHSSGGYGALVHAMRHGEHWGAVACHSGDMGFDLLYRSDLPKAVRALDPYKGDPAAFITALADAPRLGGDDFYAMMILAMAGSYDPQPDAPLGLRLPVDPHTCELDPAAWRRWLNHDPLTLAKDPNCQARLRDLGAVYIDCGSRDEYNLHFGSRQLCQLLRAAQVEHRYEEFPDGHSKVAYRLDESLPFLSAALHRSLVTPH